MTQANLGSSVAPAADPPLLATKLYVPRVHADTVARPRLLRRVDNALRVPLTLIAAPAGFGKTTIIIQWLHEAACPVAWVSLDEQDNDPATFLRYLVAALQSVAPTIGAPTLTLLSAPPLPGIEALLTPLLNEIAALERDLVLVLDDYHVLHAPAIHEGVTFLVEHLPPHLHLVIATRADPPLPLTRLRARRQLIEIRAADLRFTMDEAAAFLQNIMQLPVSTADVAALEQRTEGWIAGLHLAALALQDRRDVARFVQAFTGSNRFIVEYLIEEVVARLPAHLHQFLLQTSVLERFCAPLCDAVVLGAAADPHDSYSRLLIEQLARMNLFVIPLDHEQRWYRYHHLFGEVLRERLLTGATNIEVGTLHRRASIWYEQHDLVPEAIHHALHTNDWTRTADLLEHYAEHLLKQGEHITLKCWLDAVPEEIVRARPRLNLAYAAVFVVTHQLEAADRVLEVAERAVAGAVELDADACAILRAEMTALRVTMTLHRSDLPRTIRLAEEALWGLPPTHLLRSTMLEHLGVAYLQTMQLQAANDVFDEAVRLSAASGNLHSNLLATLNQASIHSERGELSRAAAAYHRTLRHVAECGVAHLPVVSLAHNYLAEVLYERNDLNAAADQLKQAITLADHGKNPRLLTMGYTNLARVHLARDDRANARLVLEQALHLAHTNQVPVRFRGPATAMAVRFWLSEGDLRAARSSIPSDVTPDDRPTYLREPEHLALARVLIAQQLYDEALRLLERLGAAAGATARVTTLVTTLALQAVALFVRGTQDAALASLARALTPAEPEGYVRIFVDEGAPMRALLCEAATRAVAPAYVARLLAAFGDEPAPSGLPPQAGAPQLLNEREIEVLRLIAAGYANREIAARLIVATSTVKWHINNLYAKLGVTSRTQALVRAKELELL